MPSNTINLNLKQIERLKMCAKMCILHEGEMWDGVRRARTGVYRKIVDVLWHSCGFAPGENEGQLIKSQSTIRALCESWLSQVWDADGTGCWVQQREFVVWSELDKTRFIKPDLWNRLHLHLFQSVQQHDAALQIWGWAPGAQHCQHVRRLEQCQQQDASSAVEFSAFGIPTAAPSLPAPLGRCVK